VISRLRARADREGARADEFAKKEAADKGGRLWSNMRAMVLVKLHKEQRASQDNRALLETKTRECQ
jgi:hypothetical protein